MHFSTSENIGMDQEPFQNLSVLSHLNKIFQNLRLPRQNIAIDESLMLWREGLWDSIFP
jgi:hypothetical protein